MSLTTFAPIKVTLCTTELWLTDLMEDLGWQDRSRPSRASGRPPCPPGPPPRGGGRGPRVHNCRSWSVACTTRAGVRAGSHSRRATRRFPRAHRGGLRKHPGGRSGALALAVFKVLLRYATSGEIRDEGLSSLGIRALWLVIAQAHKKQDRATPLGDPACVVRGPSPCRSL